MFNKEANFSPAEFFTSKCVKKPTVHWNYFPKLFSPNLNTTGNIKKHVWVFLNQVSEWSVSPYCSNIKYLFDLIK